MAIWFGNPTIEATRAHHSGLLASHLGIEFLEFGADYLRGSMPVEPRTLSLEDVRFGYSKSEPEILRGVSASIGRPSPTVSSAAASTSGRSTIPAPPPAGVSSTLRCLSVAKSRMFFISSDQMPSLKARPAKLAPKGPGNMSG